MVTIIVLAMVLCISWFTRNTGLLLWNIPKTRHSGRVNRYNDLVFYYDYFNISCIFNISSKFFPVLNEAQIVYNK